MKKSIKQIGRPTRRLRHADESWLRLRNAIADEIIGKLPRTLPLDEIVVQLSIPFAEVRRGLEDGSIVTTVIAGEVHMVCEASHAFLHEQSRIRLPLPESLRPIGIGSCSARE